MSDPVKLINPKYRKEDSMVRKYSAKLNRSRKIFGAMTLDEDIEPEADLVIDDEKKTLTVCLHHLANKHSNRIVSHLCKELNETRTKYPGTDYRLVYEILT